MTEGELDAWLPDPAVRTHHRRTAQVSPEVLWAAASAVRLKRTPTLGRLVQWRLPGTKAGETFHGLLSTEPFVVLDESERSLLTGMCGRIWTLRRDYPRIDGPEEYRRWRTPGTVRVLFAHWVEADGPKRSTLVSEARVAPVDRRAAFALRSLWLVVGRFERRIGSEALALAVRDAEAG